MSRFLSKILLYFAMLSMVTLMYLLLIYLRPELVDSFYYRFTTSKANSLVLGTSRSAQGIKPSVINKRICTEKNRIINHSFAIGPSSFGPNYYKEITKKLEGNYTRGLFILSVDPWSLATDILNVDDDSLQFFEVRREMFVGNLKSSSTNPNIDYLFNYWNNKFSAFINLFKLAIDYKNLLILHKDGWLEMDIEMDPTIVEKRINNSTEEYSKKNEKLSLTRLYFLDRMVMLLMKHGDVYLVRMPVSAPMAEVEKNKFPDFEEKIQSIAEKYQIYFFDFIDESGDFEMTDTHHLYRKESERFSNQLCDSISINRYKHE